jgi:hypothetical protein
MPGNKTEIADAEQDYIQAYLKGNDCWICLPPDARVRLKNALYGHPAFTFAWIFAHCSGVAFDAFSRQAGFVYGFVRGRLQARWASSEPQDRLELASARAYDRTRTESGTLLWMYIYEVGIFKVPGGKLATSLTYNVESFLDSCVQNYDELAGGNVRKISKICRLTGRHIAVQSSSVHGVSTPALLP